MALVGVFWIEKLLGLGRVPFLCCPTCADERLACSALRDGHLPMGRGIAYSARKEFTYTVRK